MNTSIRKLGFLTKNCLSVASILFCLSFVSTSFAQSELKPIEIFGKTMGPIKFKVIVSDYPTSVTKEQLDKDVNEALEKINRLMSTYIPDSDVSRFNLLDSTEFLDVDAETAQVVRRAIEISEQTNGAFDITVGPAVNLWNFGPDKSEFKLPSKANIAATMKLVGYKKLEVRMNPPGIRKSDSGLQIDLSAIAKGYAVDQVGVVLKAGGCKSFLVEVGGEVMARGERAGGGPWRIAVEKPARKELTPVQIALQPQAYDHVAKISNCAMATSGDYRNFVEFESTRYSHTIDPSTCRPVTHSTASACVVAPDCMTADALATAMMVMGTQKGSKVLKELGIEYLVVDRTDGDKFAASISAGFPLNAETSEVQPANAAANGQSILPTFIAAAVIFGLVILAMAVGSIFNNKPVQGSCGGLANMTNEDGDTECGICSKPVTDCVENAEATA